MLESAFFFDSGTLIVYFGIAGLAPLASYFLQC
jgi:hypothetical protein